MSKKHKSKKKSNQKASSNYENNSLYSFILFGIALIILMSLLSFSHHHDSNNWLGLMGHQIGWGFNAIFGVGSYPLSFFVGWIGWRKMFLKPTNNLEMKVLYMTLFTISFCMLLSFIEDHSLELSLWLRDLFYPNVGKIRYHLGGAPFYYFYRDLPSFNLFRMFNSIGVAIIFSSTLMISLLFLFKLHPAVLLRFIKSAFSSLPKSKPEPEKQKILEPTIIPNKKESDFLRFVKLRIPGFSTGNPVENYAGTQQQELLAIQPETNLKARPSVSRKELVEPPLSLPFEGTKSSQYSPMTPAFPPKEPVKKEKFPPSREASLTPPKIHHGDFSTYIIPPLSLFTTPKKMDQSLLKKDLRRQAEVLEETLLSFGIEAKVGQINCGPTITSFEVHPAIGVKVQKIKTLENDIALNMEAKSIRIIAPIPGKAAVGIEVPNPQPQEVGFKDMLTAYQQGNRKFQIPLLLGKAVNGDYVMSDLAKMPHCIIAGATGSGKSVCINTIVMSILLNAKPDEIKLIMVDPKKVELTPYTRLPHMLAPVITEPHGASSALNWLVKEMENRYEILKLVGVRNIEGFNARTINKEFETSLSREIPPRMPYIVGIVDELADLMMVASQDIETPIARIAQMARAVGIHLILATQRPSREVITGLIKANFPTRICFKVASRINSQIVLDEVGAESLLGNGDMLFLPPGTSHLVRAQGAFIRDEECTAIVKHICDQAPPNYAIESFDHYHLLDSAAINDLAPPSDPLYDQALDIVISTGNASTTFLQRKLKIGYARAASLMDQLEVHGVVGPAEGSKPRKILVARQGNIQDSEEELVDDE